MDFRFEYEAPTIRFGTGATADLADELANAGAGNALVVTGTSVGANDDVMTPIRDGLGDTLAGTFAETTPQKLLSTALDGADAYADVGADSVVAVGGGSSLDVARAVCALAATDDRDAAVDAYRETRALPVPESVPPLVVVPTTLPGADLSSGGGLNAAPPTVPEPVSGGVGGPALVPAAAFYDPDLLATTPRGALASSAMNGFDKGIEAIYTRAHTPITDATAAKGLRRLRDTLPAIGPDGRNPDYEGLFEGILLVQYGIKRPDASGLGLIHAFGHGLTAHSAIQQGSAHAIAAPHALSYLFDHVDARRDLLADALAPDADDPAEGVVEAVVDVRDALGLPGRLRDVEDIEESELDAITETTYRDSLLGNLPDGVDPTVEELRGVLDSAW